MTSLHYTILVLLVVIAALIVFVVHQMDRAREMYWPGRGSR